jgi:hypothetical protein
VAAIISKGLELAAVQIGAKILQQAQLINHDLIFLKTLFVV